MSTSLRLRVAVLMTVLFAVSAVPSFASSFFNYRQVMLGEYAVFNWIYFGGCEKDNNQACFDRESNSRGTFFNIGDENVKQGVYQLSAAFDHTHGFLVLNYSYQFRTKEDKNNTTDQGIIKLKDIDTNQIYYQKILTPSVGNIKEWQDVRVGLHPSVAGKRLQLVFEVINDAERLTTMRIDRVYFTHLSQPAIHGTITYDEVGKEKAAVGAIVKAKNKKGEIVATTTTDENGDYELFPLKRRKSYAVHITLPDGRVALIQSGELTRGYAETIDHRFTEQ